MDLLAPRSQIIKSDLPDGAFRSLPEDLLSPQAMHLAELGEAVISLRRINSEAIPDLHLILGAEPHRLAIGLFLMIAPVHAAVEAGAVPDAEHMTGLMYGDLERPTDERRGVEIWVTHAIERPHPDTVV